MEKLHYSMVDSFYHNITLCMIVGCLLEQRYIYHGEFDKALLPRLLRANIFSNKGLEKYKALHGD